MNFPLILSTAIAWFDRVACRLREARRIRHELGELGRMGSHELRDLGLSHTAIAATAPRASCCA